METLYIADLDGTLLDENARLSQESIALLRPLIQKGLPFTVATARSPATAVELLRPLGLQLPAILMTGTLLYSLAETRTLATTTIDGETAATICAMLDASGQNAMAYQVRDGALRVCHRAFTGELEQHFYSQRKASAYKTFVQVNSFTQALAAGSPLMFLFCVPTLEAVTALYQQFSPLSSIECYFYQYEYDTPGYLLEIFPKNCSKASGVQALRNYTGAKRVIAFGDNVNDLPLFGAADESCAVENACAALKECATHIIAPNTQHGVARWIAAHARGAL